MTFIALTTHLKPLRLSILFFISIFTSCFSQANQTFAINDPDVALSVNGISFSPKSLWVLYQRVAHSKRPVSFEKLIDGVIENRILAQEAKKALGDEIYATTHVGYPIKVYLDDQYIGLLQSAYYQKMTDEMTQLLGSKPEALFTSQIPTNIDNLKKILSLEKLMEYKIPKQHMLAAQQLMLAEFSLPNENERYKISLAELYNRENIQGKIRFHQMDIPFITSELNKLVGMRSMEWWARQHSGLTTADITNLRRFLTDKLAKRKLLNNRGLNLGLHDSNPVLDATYKTVTQAEINRFYDKHLDDFKRVDYVEVRHIRLNDQKTARKVQKKLMFGMDFSEAVKKYSISDDKSTTPPGYLGKIEDTGKRKTWMQSVVFILSPGKPGRPIRSPQSNGKVYWEIFFVDKRVEGHYKKDSETVKYIAGKEIALKKIENKFLKLRKQLFDKAKVGMNNQALASINYL